MKLSSILNLHKRLASWILRKDIQLWQAKYKKQYQILDELTESSSALLKEHHKLVAKLRGDGPNVPVKRALH